MNTNLTWQHIVLIVVTALVSGLVTNVLSRMWDARLEKRERKYDVFVTLMSGRYSLVSEQTVRALNMVNTVFYDDDKVCALYKEFLAEANKPEDGKPDIDEKFLKLMEEMAAVIGFGRIKWDDVKRKYFPPEFELRNECEMLALKKSAGKA